MRGEEDEANYFAQLSLLLEHHDCLLLAQRNLGSFLARDPGVLQRRARVIPQRWREGAKIEEEVFGERREIVCESPRNRLSFNVLQLFVVVLVVAAIVTRVLAARKQLVCDYATRPEVYLFRVTLFRHLLGCHVEKSPGFFALLVLVVLLGTQAEVDDFYLVTVFAIVAEKDVLRLQVPVHYVACVHVGHPLKKTFHNPGRLQI